MYSLYIRYSRFVQRYSFLGCGIIPYHLNAQTSSVNANIQLSGKCPKCGIPPSDNTPFLARLWICIIGIPVIPLHIQALLGCTDCHGGFIRWLTENERHDLIYKVNSWSYNNLGSHGSYGRLWIFILPTAALGYMVGSAVVGHAVIGTIAGWGLGGIMAVKYHQSMNTDHPQKHR